MKALTKVTANLLKPLVLNSTDRLRIKLNRDGDKFVADIFGQTLSGQRTFASTTALTRFIDRIPERTKLDSATGACWEVAATDYTASIIHHVWPADQIFWEPDAKVVQDYLLLTTQQQEQCADLYGKFHAYNAAKMDARKSGMNDQMVTLASGYAPQFLPKHYEEHSNPERRLALYQKVALHNSMISESYNLFMEQGTGKTPVVIAHVNNSCDKVKKEEKRPYRGIIVCPKNVRRNWEKEFEKFSFKKVKAVVIRGGEIDRIKRFIDAFRDPSYDAIIIIISYETLSRMMNVLEKIEWDIGVLDEGHYIKWPGTIRAKFSMKLRDICRKRMLLTGSPVTNTALDLYSQLEYADKGGSGFMSWKNFRSFYGVFKKCEGDDHERLVGMQNLPFMQERLARKSFIVSKKQALPYLPDKVYDIIEVEMTPEQAEIYKQVATNLMVEIENDLDSGRNKAMVMNNVLTKLLRLAQITSGFVTWDPIVDDEGNVLEPKVIDTLSPNTKLDVLVEELKTKGPDSKTIIWACWVHDIKAISNRLTAEGIKCVTYFGGTSDADRQIAEDSFNEDTSVKVFIGNAAAGGTGLNLLGYPPLRADEYTTNVDHVIYYSQNWSPTARWQSEDRAHRRGTRVHVRYSDLCVPGTIDEEIRARVVEKKLAADSIADIREILKNVLRGVGE